MAQGKDNVFHPGVDMNLPNDPRSNADRFQWDDGTPNTVRDEQGERERDAGGPTGTGADIEYYDISGFSLETPQPVAVNQSNNMVRNTREFGTTRGESGQLGGVLTGGNDPVFGGEGTDGDDTINGGAGDDELNGKGGHDDIYGQDGADTIDGGDGNDNIWGGNHADTIFDGAGNDDIFGENGNDTIYVSDGNDTVSGGADNDEIHIGGFGNNVVSGGSGVDTVVFGNAAIVVNLGIDWANRGVEGIDTITGVENITTGTGADILTGTAGNNVINSGGGHDVASGLEGHDIMYGGSGEDTLWGNEGNDDLIGGSGDDELWGQEGVDEIYGEAGNDTLNGGADSDQISGGANEDRIRGGSGEDWMIGGADADTFVWNAGDVDVPVIDQILDFDVNEDLFSFGAGFFDAGPGAFNLSSVLVAAPHAGGDSLLWADTDTVAGWQVIARLKDVSAADLNQKIQNGSILDVETVFEGPGDFLPVHDDGGMFGIGFGADFIM